MILSVTMSHKLMSQRVKWKMVMSQLVKIEKEMS